MRIVAQHLFTLGEVDEINWKRTDIEVYLTGAQILLNCEVATTGLARKRKGTLYKLTITGQVDPNSRFYEFLDNKGVFYIIMSAPTNFYIYIVNPDSTLTLYQTVSGTPYVSADLPLIDFSLDGDSLVLTHGSYPQARVYVSSYTPAVFGYMALNIFPYPAYDFSTINYNAATATLTGSGDTITLVITPVTGFTTAWIGGQIIGSGNSDLQPVGSAIITNVVVSGTTTTFTGQVQIPFNLTTPATVGSQYSIRQPAWSAALGYPKKVIFYQNRLWFANTQTLPDTIFGSRLNQPISFDVGTGLDTDAIVYNIGQSDTGGINWMNAGKQLEIYTENNELVAPQDQNNALTPSTFSIRQQSSYGSLATLKPLTYINDSYYVSRDGISIVNFHYNGIGQSYTSSNVSLQSTHLVTNPTKAQLIRGASGSQDNFIYFGSGGTSITIFQFAAEYKLAALTPMTFNYSPTINVQDIVAVNNQLYVIKNYVNSGQTTIELVSNNSVSPLVVKMDSTSTVSIDATGLVTGIAYLNGYTAHLVSPIGDLGSSQQIINGELEPRVVTAGQCYFDNPNKYVGTATIGILFETRIVPPYIGGSLETTDYLKNISRIYVDYYQSLDFTINGTPVFYQNFAEIQAGLGLQSRTSTAVISSTEGWNRFSTFTIDQTSPYDLQITGILYQIGEAII